MLQVFSVIMLFIFGQPRILYFCALFLIDIYDSYLHKYPTPKTCDIFKIIDKGAFAKYESFYGRLAWMIISYISWFLLAKKNIEKALMNDSNGSSLSIFEIGCILCAISGFLLRVWCKHVMGKYYTYSTTIYKKHVICDVGPYSIVRHPGYAGLILNWGGVFLWLNHWWGYATLALVIHDAYYNALPEEIELVARVPQYIQYKKRVRSLIIPYVF